MEGGAINYVAWWGAIIATLLLIWDVMKWFKSGARIRALAWSNVWYMDGEVTKSEKVEGGVSKVLADYCHIELINTGNLPTTIMGIEAAHTPGKIVDQYSGRFGFTRQAFTPHFNKKLPAALAPGEVWSCRFAMSNLVELAKHGSPYIKVHVSHKKKPIVLWPEIDQGVERTSE